MADLMDRCAGQAIVPVILLEIDVSGENAQRLRVASAGWDGYEARLLDSSWLQRTLFRHAAPFGPPGSERAWMVIGNLDGRLDWLAEASVDGLAARVHLADPAGRQPEPVFSGLVEQTLVGSDAVTLVLCERQALLEDGLAAAAAGSIAGLARDLGVAMPAEPEAGWLVRCPPASPRARLEALAASAGAWAGSDAGGDAWLRPLLPPEAVPPALDLDSALEPLPAEPSARAFPLHQVEILGAGGRGLWTCPAVRHRNPLARRLTLETMLVSDAQAGALAERLGGLFGPPRRRWRAELPPAMAAALDLGMTVSVRGRRLMVTGLELSLVSRRLVATLWG